MITSKRQSSLPILISDYIFYIIPFIILTIVRIAQGTEIGFLILISDWSIASTIMFGQVVVKLCSALVSTSRSKKIPAITLYLTVLVCFGLLVNIVVYALMLITPSTGIGIFQLILFIFASLCHFILGSAINHINNN